MAYWIDGIERPSKEDFEKHDRTIRKLTLLVSDPDFDSGDAYDTLQDRCNANTVRNYYQQLLSRWSPKRHRDDADTPSDSEDTRRPSKMPQMPASKKRSRDVDSSEDEETSRPFKTPRMPANKKRSRDAVDTSDSGEDEGKPKPSKKARLGAQKVEMTQAVRELQDLLNSSAKGSK